MCKIPEAGIITDGQDDLPWCLTSETYDCMSEGFYSEVMLGFCTDRPTDICFNPCKTLRYINFFVNLIKNMHRI